MAGNIWQVLVEPGQIVKENDVVMILEAMKMELEVTASVSGVIDSICHEAGAQVHAGEPLLVVNTCSA
ncbi:urea carboxylase [Vibrio astriarenae]|nr:urea carboxylase [Vibrio sp. C7]